MGDESPAVVVEIIASTYHNIIIRLIKWGVGRSKL